MFGMLADIVVYGKKRNWDKPKAQYVMLIIPAVLPFIVCHSAYPQFKVSCLFIVPDGQAIYIEEFPVKLLDQLESKKP